jgi:superfamily II DNA helicase RecQ
MRILVVIVTRSSKSVLFMLPTTVIGSSYTVVIALLNALIKDLVVYCKVAGILCAA